MTSDGDKMIVPVVDDGLGNSAYLVDLGDGRALAVDASLDLRALRRAADRRGLKVAFAADTHLHADFLSGAIQLARTDDARVLASAAGGREFTHTGLADGAEVDLGGLTLRALATPGHTGEHLAFQLLDGSSLLGVFTGGSLIVGGAARTDLAGAERTEELTRAQYRSLRRLAELPDSTPVWPTHGAGSFCSAPSGGDRTTTIGQEKATNTLLATGDEEAFVQRLLTGLGSYPPYFLRLPELNRRGLSIDSEPRVPSLSEERVAGLVESGTILVDVRPVPDFAAAHIPGALSIPLRAQYASWLGWLVEPGTEYVVVRNPDQDLAEIAWQAAKIGHNLPAGELAGGIAGWSGPTTSTPLLNPGQVSGRELLDVRQLHEFHGGHVPGAQHIELGELPDRTSEAAESVVVMCGHGERAMTAASILERAGKAPAGVLDGGPQDVATVTGNPLA